MKTIELNKLDDETFQIILEDLFCGYLTRQGRIVGCELEPELFSELKQIDQKLASLVGARRGTLE